VTKERTEQHDIYSVRSGVWAVLGGGEMKLVWVHRDD
jgi:hypothetical protein